MSNRVLRLTIQTVAFAAVFVSTRFTVAAPVVTVQASSLDALLAETATIVGQLELPMPEPAIAGMIGNALKAPGLVGIDRAKPLQMHVVMPMVIAAEQLPSSQPAKPSMVFVLPLAGDGALYFSALEQMFSAPVTEGRLRHFGGSTMPAAGEIYTGTAGGYVVLGSESSTVEEVLSKFEQNGIKESCLLKLPGTLLVGIDAAECVKLIEVGSQQALQAMQQQQMPAGVAMDPARILKAEFDALLGIMRQIDGYTISVGVREKSVDFYSRVDPVPDSVVAQVIQSHAVPSAKYAGFVPEDALFAISGSGMNIMDTIAEPYSKLVEEIYGAMGPQFSTLSPTIRKLMTDISGIYAGDYAIGVVLGADGKVGMMEAIALTDPKRAKEVIDEMMASYNDTFAKSVPGLSMQTGEPRVQGGVQIQSFAYKIDPAAAAQAATPMPMPKWLDNLVFEVAYIDDSLLYTVGGPAVMDTAIARMKGQGVPIVQSPRFTGLIPRIKYEPVQAYTMSLAKLIQALLSQFAGTSVTMPATMPVGNSGMAGFALVRGDNYIDFDRVSFDEIVGIKNMMPVIQQAMSQFMMSQAAAMGQPVPGAQQPNVAPVAP